MAHPIPKPFKWSNEFEVFYANLDDEHRGLFDGIFACGEANTAENYGALVEKVKTHFANEEKMMSSSNYANFATHKQAHDEFVGKCGGLSAPLSDDNLIYLQQWLVDHIKGIDFKYKGKLN
ncbi:DgyrCDS7758 [Dimorphilus gyrociliatus]|uniref:DgyrCDS7758 n=1 Tax=Dimorphilus gyrociliatus TaxID=2664684 RepID=A0A7I8VTS0_9ANNE|nr:DgyrCDS7758 [Dimorphilus gyrociliatus]